MADTPAQPPGWPYNQDPNAGMAPPPGPPSFEPPPQPAPPMPPPQPAPAPPMPPPQPAQQPPAPPGSYPPPAPYPPAQPPAPPGSYPPPAPYPPANQYEAQPVGPGPAYGGPGQPPPPPQGWGPPPPPAKSSKRNIWITLAVIFGVLILGIGACTAWFIGTVTAPVDEANRFLAAIDNRDYASAVAMTDPACNAGVTAADIDRLFAGADITYDLKSSSVVNSSATVSGAFSASGLNYTSIELSLRKSGDWSVCGFRVF